MIVGIDIGGTKCATVIAHKTDDNIEFLSRIEIKTLGTAYEIIHQLIEQIKEQLTLLNLTRNDIERIDISCGGPLDNQKGIILSPPNLLGWDNIHICDILTEEFKVPCKLQNDADASAVAEWHYGAAKGYKNAIFLTFGTGLGAGLILNNQLYSGSNGMAGEVGHIRLAKTGPIGYGKKGSFEGFCSGGGIAQQIQSFIKKKKSIGITMPWFDNSNMSAKDLSLLAQNGDTLALELFSIIGRYFGMGLSKIIDILNPEVIVIGGIYMRAHQYMDASMYKVLNKETLPHSMINLQIKPSKLDEQIGDYACVCASL